MCCRECEMTELTRMCNMRNNIPHSHTRWHKRHNVRYPERETHDIEVHRGAQSPCFASPEHNSTKMCRWTTNIFQKRLFLKIRFRSKPNPVCRVVIIRREFDAKRECVCGVLACCPANTRPPSQPPLPAVSSALWISPSRQRTITTSA